MRRDKEIDYGMIDKHKELKTEKREGREDQSSKRKK